VAQACANAMAEQNKPAIEAANASSAPIPIAGSIIFIASIATHIASTAQRISTYAASKAAIRGLVKPLAMELAEYGIRVNSLSPGYMMTDMMRSLQQQQPTLVAQFEKETLFRRIGYPEELKGAVLFLASQASGWYTGQDLLVDGGATSWKHAAPL
jgi:sorbose reductase